MACVHQLVKILVPVLALLDLAQSRPMGTTAILAFRVQQALKSGKPIVPFDRHFFRGKALIEGTHWLVFFCGGQDSEQCAIIREEFLRVSTASSKPVEGMHFAEVDCTREADFCQRQDFATQPAAVVYYFNGEKQAAWHALERSASVNALLRWIQTTFHGGSDSNRYWDIIPETWEAGLRWCKEGAASFLQRVDLDMAVLLVGVIIFQIGVVTWVIMEGFEMRPKTD